MKNKLMKKLIPGILSGIVLWGSFSNVAFGQSVSENSEVEVTFETTINFTEEESKQYLATLEADVKETIEALTNEMLLSNDKIKEDYIESLIDALNNADVADVFDDSKNTSITIPMIAVNVDVGDETSTTDETGTIVVDTDEVENVINDCSYSDYEVTTENRNIKIKNNITFNEFAEGIYEMSENMTDSMGQACKTYAKKSKGYSWGSNRSTTVVCYSTNSYPNIVYCNKCDKSTTESKNMVTWAVGGSDCAKSVRLGIIATATTNPLLRALYVRSINCVIESCASLIDAVDHTSTTNIYCNGKKKSGTHWNCSWFSGIGHTESFHTHY